MKTEYMLRHCLAVIKYRCSKVIEDVQENYPTYDVGNGVRTPIEILNHISLLLRYAQSVFRSEVKIAQPIETWSVEVNKFYKELELLDQYLAEGLPNSEKIFERLLQGPIADAMTHVGQLAMIRRLSGDPIQVEDYSAADIQVI